MKNSTWFAVLVLAVLAGGSGSAQAGADRTGGTGLYLTQSAETLTPGAVRAGAYGQYVRYVVSEDPETWDLAPQLAWSPARDFEIMFAIPLLRHQITPDGKETGIGDGVVGLKYRLFPQVAALSYVSLPFGSESRSLGSGGTEVGIAGLLSLPLGAGVVADFNVGYQFTGVSGTAGENYALYGLGLSVPVGVRTKIFGEIAGRAGRQPQIHDTLQFDLGLRHQLSDRVSLTVGAGRGTTGDFGFEDSRLRLFAGFDVLFGGSPAGAGPAAPGGGAPAAPVAAVPVVAAPAVVAPAVVAAPPVVAAAPVAVAPTAAATPAVVAPAVVAVPAVAAAPAHTAPELEAARKRLAAAEILFEYDRTRLTPEGERALQEITADMLKYAEISFVIEGNADSRGTASYNKVLGLRRAEMVMRYMVRAGISFDRLKVVTQGEMNPRVSNKDDRGMALNRRVVFSAL